MSAYQGGTQTKSGPLLLGDTYRVGVLSGEREVGFQTLELEEPGPGQVLVQVHYCAVCTLEQRIYKGVIKRYPFAGGHEIYGVVEAVGDSVSGVGAGDKVALRMLTSCGECYYCRSGHENQCVVSFKAAVHEGLSGPGGFSEYMLVDAKNVYKLGDDIDLSHAALSEPLACCVHSVCNAGIQLGDDVVVVGVGIMGALHIQLAKLRGARVIACEIDEERLEMARSLVADITVNSSAENAVERVRALTEGRGANVVFCTAAIPQLAGDSVEMAGKLGRVILYSSFHPDLPVELNVNRVHSNEPIITGSVNPRMCDFQTATRLLYGGLINVEPLISGVYGLAELQEAFDYAIDPKTYRVVVKCTDS